MSYATDEMERLSKVVEEQAALLERSRTLNTEKENNINTLEEKVLPLLRSTSIHAAVFKSNL